MSTEALVTIENGKAVGRTAHDAAALAEMEGGEYRAVFTIPRGRSVPQNNLFHAFCDFIADNDPDDSITSRAVKHVLKIETGLYDVVKVGDLFARVPRSVAFNKMEPPEFGEFMDRALTEAIKLFGLKLAGAAYSEMIKMAGVPVTTRESEAVSQAEMVSS